MENPTPGVTGRSDADKSPDQIEREMEGTRDSITEKVSLLENQVMGNINTVTTAVGSVKDAVTETVQAVKEAVTTAPTAVSDTVKQTLTSVKDSVRDTVSSFRVSEYVRDNPWGSVGASTAVGFVTGLLIGSSRSGGVFGRPIMARADDAPTPIGRAGGVHTAYAGHEPARAAAAPGMFSGLFGSLSNEIRQLAEQAISTAVASLRETISTQVPKAVDEAVHKVTDRVATVVGGHGEPNGSGTTRVGGPNYTATPPAGGL